jgi:NAD(P)-dependent dehydrogenase (short-subunit alcohol dehydrogenase family)
MTLQNQTVIIFGGSSGIGFATAKLAIAKGAKVMIVGRSEEKLEQAAQALGQAQIAVADIANETNVHNVFASIDHVDHVVVLSGSAVGGKILETKADDMRRAIDERIWGPIYVVQNAVPKMTQGSITLTSGLFSERPAESGVSVVTAAVAGVEGLTRALTREIAPIRVNTINFGWIQTPHHEGLGEKREEIYAKVAAALPGKRIGTVEEGAQAILFALSNEYLNGEILHLDGGARLV